MDATALEDSPRRQNIVTFRLDRHTYALPIEPVERIVEMVAMTPVPQLEDWVEGIINVHGTAVAVVKLRRHLGLPDAPVQLDTPIVLIRVGGLTVGLIVDEVLDVHELSAEQIAPLTDVLPQELVEAPVLRGLAYVSDKAVLMLDPENLFRPDQLQALAQATEILAQIKDKPPAKAGKGRVRRRTTKVVTTNARLPEKARV